MKNMALTAAGIIFLLVTILHFLRYYQAWTIVIGQYTIPSHWSLFGGIITAALAIWMFAAARK